MLYDYEIPRRKFSAIFVVLWQIAANFGQKYMATKKKTKNKKNSDHMIIISLLLRREED